MPCSWPITSMREPPPFVVFTSLNQNPCAPCWQWCDDNPDEPLSLELLGLLPAALESPTRVAVALFVTTRWVLDLL